MQRSLILLSLLLACLLIGCGTGDRSAFPGAMTTSGGPTGRASFTIVWPARSRLIPAASNSIVILLKNGTQAIANQTVPRPQFNTPTTSTADFTNIPPGSYSAILTAYPNTNGTGTAQSTAAVPVQVIAGQTATVPVTLASTIATVTLAPQNPTLNAGQNVNLTLTAKDAGGNVVLTAPAKVQWGSSDTNVATLTSATGNSAGVTGVHAGTAQITVTETESGKAAMTTVTVVNPLTPLYIADTDNHRIVRMDDMSGANLVSFGSLGSGSGQFNQPTGVAVDANNRIYIADYTNNRIVRMDDMTGANFTTFGTAGRGTGQFSRPRSVFIDSNGHIYVADSFNNRIVRFDDANGQISNWAVVGGVTLEQPEAVYVGSNNKITIADTYNFRIVQVDDMNGTNLQAIGDYGITSGHFLLPQGVFVQGGHIFVSDGGNRIIRMDDMQGNGWVELHQFGSGTGQFSNPFGIFVDTNARIYVADSNNNRITRMDDLTGANWTAYPASGVSPFLHPKGICLH